MIHQENQKLVERMAKVQPHIEILSIKKSTRDYVQEPISPIKQQYSAVIPQHLRPSSLTSSHSQQLLSTIDLSTRMNRLSFIKDQQSQISCEGGKSVTGGVKSNEYVYIKDLFQNNINSSRAEIQRPSTTNAVGQLTQYSMDLRPITAESSRTNLT